VSKGHFFLEKFLKLDDTIELHQVSPEDMGLYAGYDLYIFEGHCLIFYQKTALY